MRTLRVAGVVTAALLVAGCRSTQTQALAPIRATATTAPAAAPQPIKISGHATAPAGLFEDHLASRPPGLIDRWLNPRAEAFAAVVAVPNATIGIWTGDAHGMVVGAPIAVATTDATGYYTMYLPPTYVVGPALILRVGDDDCALRRVVTGVVRQDISLETEIGLRVVLEQTTYYPVDVRVIPAPRYEVIYTTVSRDLVDYDFRPLIVKKTGPRRIVFADACGLIVHRLHDRPAVVTVVRDNVNAAYIVAKREGRGVLPMPARQAVGHGRPEPAAENHAQTVLRRPDPPGKAVGHDTEQSRGKDNGHRAEPARPAQPSHAKPASGSEHGHAKASPAHGPSGGAGQSHADGKPSGHGAGQSNHGEGHGRH